MNKKKFVKIAVSTTLSVGIAVSGTGYSGSAWAQVAGMGWSTDDRETVLQPIEEDSDSQTFSVASLLSGKIYNSETTGIAVMDTDSTNGTWEYYNTETRYWYNIETVVDGNALILLSSSGQIRFKPNPNWNGQASIQYKLWDMTGHSNFAKNVDTNSPAFSVDQGVASITVTPVNDAPYLTEADGGEYLDFNGNGDFVDLSNQINDIYANSFTVEGYLKVRDFYTWMRFFESSNGEGSNNVFVGFDKGKMNFSAYDGSKGPEVGAVNNITTRETFPKNQWVHVAFVYNQGEKKGYIYWDGELKASGAADLSTIGGRLRHNHWLGQSSWGQDGYYFGGMKDVSFWSKAKSREEIINGMNTELTGGEPGLVAHYNLDQGSPLAISTPPGIEGTINNATHKQADGFMGAVTTDMNRTAERSFKVLDIDGDELQVTAISSDQNLVSNDNLVISGVGENRILTIKPTANRYGTARITVMVNDGALTNNYDLQLIVNELGEVIVTDVTLSTDRLDLTVGGEKELLSASVSPANAENLSVIWSSSNPLVATVDENGFVTAVGPGTTIITVTTVDGDHTDTVTVNVADKPGAPENVTAIPGDGEATINFTAPAFDGGSPITNYTVTAHPGGITVSGTGSPIKVTGLDNGTAYTFTVVATNRAGDSITSVPTGSVTPVPPTPGAPALFEPIAGNGEVTLSWSGVDDATGYKVFQGESPESINVEVATVTDSVYSHTITGLTNGQTYYFVLKATNIGSDSAPSLPVSATPMTVPGIPTGVTAVAGNRQATITFTPPVDHGGSPITGYEVTAMPGNHKVFGTTSPITMTGLDNGTSYTFTVTAINTKGSSEQSVETEPVMPYVPSVPPIENETNSPAQPTTPAPVPVPAPQKESEILMNGKAEDIGTVSTSEQNGQSVTKVSLDEQKLNDKLAGEGSSSVLSITSKNESDVLIGELTGQTVKNLEKTETKLEIRKSNAAYTLPAEAIRIDEISKELGAAALQDIKIEVKVAATNSEMVKVIENAAVNGKFTLVAPAVDFSVTATYGNQSVEISEFNQFVTRMIVIPDGVDVSKITTGVTVDANGSVRHVPTKVTQIDSKYYAVINSLTSGSSYSVIWNPIEFSDVEGHWAQSAVNNMGSRMVADGVGNGLFNPDQNITRAEFAAIVVRGLGLARENMPSSFTDVAMSDWYNSAVITAAEFGLIQGFGDGTFRPNEQITREQAMVIIAKAMELTELNSSLQADASQLNTFVDAPEASNWASMGIVKSVQAGIIKGRSETKLAPKANMTRAEVAAIVERLLQKSELI